jgi:hypothetical protein
VEQVEQVEVPTAHLEQQTSEVVVEPEVVTILLVVPADPE